MASVVLPPIAKTPDLHLRTSILPKRRTPVSGAPTRSRFAKPRPNINALVNKTVKETPPPEAEKVTVLPEEISKPAEVSKDTTTAALPVETPAEIPSENSNKEEIISTSISPEQVAEKVEEVLPSSLTEKAPADDPPPCVVENVEITPPRSKNINEVELEKEISIPTPSKTTEYPTLKSILNSPRKRVTAKKNHERRKRFANGAEIPPRSEMTMLDLIYYNPSGSPMKSAKPVTNPVVEVLPYDENAAPIEDEENSEGTVSLTPKVIISETGEIIIDESSLVIRRKETVNKSVAAIIENDNTTYSSFRKKTSKQWTNKETAKFYKALSLVGTDFALMENIFTVDGKVTRTRRELKLKFKREERQNTELVHQAMYETQTYDLSILEDDPDDVPAITENEPKKSKRSAKSDKAKKKKECQEEQSISAENTAASDYTDLAISKTPDGKGAERLDVIESENAGETSIFLDLVPCYENQPVPCNSEVSTVPNESVYYCYDESEANQADTASEISSEREPSEKDRAPEVNSVCLDSPQRTDALDAGKVMPSTEDKLDPSYSPVEKKSADLSEVVPSNEEVMGDKYARNDQLSEIEKAPARSQRIRKAKVLSDFITDVVLSDSDDEEMPDDELYVEKMSKSKNSYCFNDEFKVPYVPRVTTKKPVDKQPLKRTKPTNSQLLKTPVEQKPTEDLEVVCIAVKRGKGVANVSEPYHHNVRDDNFLTDAAISEVVTSEAIPRRFKRKAAPNITRATKRPLLPKIQQQTRSPSFSNFTPSEDGFKPPKYTYSKKDRSFDHVSVSSMPLQSQVSVAPALIAPSQTSYYTSAVPEAQPIAPQSQLSESQRTIPAYNGNQSPVMILAKSLNNENILHLFVVKNPSENS